MLRLVSVCVFPPFWEEVTEKCHDALVLGPFHSSCSFWTVFTLLSSHSLCTAFTATQSALPIDLSGLRSANPWVCHHRVVQASSISAAARQLWGCSRKLPPSTAAAAAFLRGRQQPISAPHPAFAKIDCFC